MAFITKNELKAIHSRRDHVLGIYESTIRLLKSANIKISTVFLSHSHIDKELIEYAKLLLMDHRVGIYIDSQDDTMSPYTNILTAERIKEKIKECNRFVMIASDNALESKWVPWELGFADGATPYESIAVFPVQEEPGKWNGNEYVGLYNTIQKFHDSEWYVLPPNRSILGRISLKKWLVSKSDTSSL